MAMLETDFDRVSAQLTVVWQRVCEPPDDIFFDAWKTCEDINLVFSITTPDGTLEIFIGDMYASMLPCCGRKKSELW